MNIKPVLHLVAFMLMVVAASMLLCAGIAWWYGDPVRVRLALAAAALCVFATGALLWVFTRGPMDLSRRDGFGIVTFGWLAAAVAGMLPYLFTGVISHPVSALFESMSGFWKK